MPQYRTIPATDKCYSEVATIGSRTLCVTVPELTECGVSEGYLKIGFKRNRTGEAYCWPHHKEGNVVYIHYDGLKDRYKHLINATLCNGIDANIWTTDRDAQKRQKELNAVCSNLPNMVNVYPEDIELVSNSGFFEGSAVQKVARAAAWLRLWRKLDVKTARKMGFTSVIEIQNALFAHCMSDQKNGFVQFPKPINTIRVLDRKAREFAKDGLKTLIGGYFGNANREIIDNVIHAVLMDLASSPLKHSFEDIAMMYNTMSEYSAQERMTTSAIKQHLNIPKHKKVWMYLRHGKQVGDDIYQSQAQRETPPNPDDLWSIDGTTAQLYYRDENGNIKSGLYIYFITDASTGAIIGSSVAYSETAGLVIEALQDAVNTHGYCPKQVQYDNSSANTQEMVTGLVDNMSRVHFPCTAYLGRAKYVEEIIGHFQQRTLRQLKNFKGGNVTTRSLDSKANPELLKWLKKNPSELPTEDEAIIQIQNAVKTWNDRGERRDNYGRWVGKSKIDRYLVDATGRNKLGCFDKISLFMVPLAKPYKYKQQGIQITMNGKKYNYIVPDPDNSTNDFMFSNDNMYREFKVRVNLNHPQYINLYDHKNRFVAKAIEKEKFAAAVANMKEGGRTKIIDFLRKQEQFGYDYALRELREQRQILAQQGLRATGTEDFFGYNGETFGWQDTPKSVFNVIESRAEDRLNGVDQPSVKKSTRNVLNVLRDM